MAEIKLFNRDCIAAMKDIEDGSIEIKTAELIQIDFSVAAKF